MTCPFNIKVCISERFFAFPYEYCIPQTDLGDAPVRQLVVYVPTDDDIQYVDKTQLQAQFDSILVYRHEPSDKIESRAPRKNATATIVYWNPIVPITEVGVGETRVFSVLLTNSLFYCNTMILDGQAPMCPIEFRRDVKYDKLIPIAANTPLFHARELLDDNINDFLICFNLETSTMVKILNVKRVLSMMGFRNVPARYTINLPDNEVDTIYNKLTWERTRRLMKGDVSSAGGGCLYVNRNALSFIRQAQELLGLKDYSQSIVDFVVKFQSLIIPYMIVPDILIKLNTLERFKHVRLYCQNDSYAITSFGPVPNNLPEDNSVAFDYSDINNSKHLFEVHQKISSDSNIDGLRVSAMRYNYFF